jgi:hypothetical protein
MPAVSAALLGVEVMVMALMMSKVNNLIRNFPRALF